MTAATDGRLPRFAAATFALSVLALFVALPSVSRLSPDAWTAYELSGTIGRDFFRANTAREYATGNAYSSALAPLWPIIVALFSRLTGSIYGSYVAAFLSYVAFGVTAEAFGRRAFGRRGIGVLSALLLLRFPGIREELGSGRSIPLYLCELTLLGVVLTGLDSAPRRRSALAGMLAGLMVMTRFDALPAAFVIVAGVPLIGVSRDRALLLGLCFVLAVSPWVAYSVVHFQSLFVTDNRAVLLSLDPRAFVLDFHADPQPGPGDAPLQWAWKVVRHVPTIGKAFVLSLVESVFVPVLLLVAAVALRTEGRRQSLSSSAARTASSYHSRAIVLFSLAAIAPIAGCMLTGYWDHRYFSGIIWLGELLLLALLVRVGTRAVRAVPHVLVLAGGSFSVAVLRHAVRASPLAAVRQELDRTQGDTLVACLRRDGAHPLDGVVFTGHDVLGRFKFGAQTGWRVLPIPSNWERLGRGEQDEFLRRYRASYVVDSRPAGEPAIGGRELVVACPLPLRRLAPAAG